MLARESVRHRGWGRRREPGRRRRRTMTRWGETRFERWITWRFGQRVVSRGRRAQSVTAPSCRLSSSRVVETKGRFGSLIVVSSNRPTLSLALCHPKPKGAMPRLRNNRGAAAVVDDPHTNRFLLLSIFALGGILLYLTTHRPEQHPTATTRATTTTKLYGERRLRDDGRSVLVFKNDDRDQVAYRDDDDNEQSTERSAITHRIVASAFTILALLCANPPPPRLGQNNSAHPFFSIPSLTLLLLSFFWSAHSEKLETFMAISRR